MSSIQNETTTMIVKDDCDFISDDENVSTLVESKININIADNTLESKTNNHKIDYNLCSQNCKSQYAFIDGISYEITKYIELKSALKDHFIKCYNGHELYLTNGEKNKPHFRHKNAIDMNSNNMSEWHIEWQSNFPMTEQWFSSKYNTQITPRRADVVLTNNIILEIQHSEITLSEVTNRNHDYNLHNMKIMWIIDGERTTICNLINGRYLLTFDNADKWKYASFIYNTNIYLDIDGKIFRINPTHVKGNMIDVNEYKLKQDFIKSLNDGNTNIWSESEYEKEILYFNQRGAGCGKTYESIQLLNNDERFNHKEIFIYLTKMHSAKEVIYNELLDQSKRGVLHNLICIENNVENDVENNKKQYKISYDKQNTSSNIKIVIGTIDSFMFAVRNKHEKINGNDYFSEIVNLIKEGNLGIKKNGSVTYAQETLYINKKCLIIIDESQDLGKKYIQATGEIMKTTGCDVYIIGDKLQSIWFEDNIYTYLENNELPLKIIKSTGINQVMRFHNTQFIKFVNSIIDFKKYNLPVIENICNTLKCKYTHDNNIKPYEIFQMPDIYKEYKDHEKDEEGLIYNFIEDIILKMEREIMTFDYLPNNFTFIFPFLSGNFLANRLESRIQQFWIEKFNDKLYQDRVLMKNDYWKDKINNNEYYKYIYLHKSDEGKSINLKESENATRIMSIHASKGSGCEVVFLLNLTERALKRFSSQKINLVYDSLLHVAITRQKKSIYIGVVDENDDIWNRLFKFGIELNEDILPNLKNIKQINKLDDIISISHDNENIFKVLNETIIQPNNYKKDMPNIPNSEKNIIDWGHHLLRYHVFLYNIWSNIAKNDGIAMDELKAKLHTIKECETKNLSNKEYYNELNKISKNNSNKQSVRNTIIPILFLTPNNDSKYHKYNVILKSFIEQIKIKIKAALLLFKLPLLCPLETSILIYMIEVYKNGKYNEITIMDIYSLMYCYDDCSDLIDDLHVEYNCICNKQFINKKDNNDLLKYKDIRNSIVNHFDKTRMVAQLYNNYKLHISTKLNGSMLFKYNIMHKVWFTDVSKNFMIFSDYNTIGYSEKYVIHFIIKPQFNELNFNKIVLEGIFNNFILTNLKPSKDSLKNANYIKYNGKKVLACIFTLDSINPVFYDFNINKNDEVVKQSIKQILLEKYSSFHRQIISFYKYCTKNKPSDGPKINSIEYTYNIIKTDYDYFPEYISTYLRDVNKEIKDAQKKKQDIVEILKKVNNDDMFYDGLHACLEEAIDRFIGEYVEENDCDF